MKRTILMLVMIFGCFLVGFGQEEPGRKTAPGDGGSYPKIETKQRIAPAYPPLREADVIYAKRIERIIDSREKKNLVMNWPKNPLSRVVYNLITTGEPSETGKVKAYSNDSLNDALPIEKILKVGEVCETIQIQRPGSTQDYDYIDTTICTRIDLEKIKRWSITEEWIFDKQRSMFFPRIISIAPMYEPMLNGVPLTERPMFYISYADLRPLLANEEVFNRQNDAMRLSYFDFFEQRLFSSYITKESNDKDFAIRDFEEYKNDPKEALYESERIKNDMNNWEEDLWER